ncbi:unnamed protein product [Symbiodinium pilosum]|uniref:Uncharacterized protein n=1 Tax=Symbiodinium pilosum TaxID=2952 RepID=A0A812QNW4_SYMPI|nr:unnamed protein product [Symbiodinium pilosum]
MEVLPPCDPFSLRPWNPACLSDLATTINAREDESPLQAVALQRLKRPSSPASFLARKVAQEACSNYPPVYASRRPRSPRSPREGRGRRRFSGASRTTGYSTERSTLPAPASPRSKAQTWHSKTSWLPRDFEGIRHESSSSPRAWALKSCELLSPAVVRGSLKSYKMHSSSSAPSLAVKVSPRRANRTLMSLVADGRQSSSKKEHDRVTKCLQGIVRRTAIAQKAAFAFAEMNKAHAAGLHWDDDVQNASSTGVRSLEGLEPDGSTYLRGNALLTQLLACMANMPLPYMWYVEFCQPLDLEGRSSQKRIEACQKSGRDLSLWTSLRERDDLYCRCWSATFDIVQSLSEWVMLSWFICLLGVLLAIYTSIRPKLLSMGPTAHKEVIGCIGLSTAAIIWKVFNGLEESRFEGA